MNLSYIMELLPVIVLLHMFGYIHACLGEGIEVLEGSTSMLLPDKYKYGFSWRKIFALGDIHGDMTNLHAILEAANIVDNEYCNYGNVNHSQNIDSRNELTDEIINENEHNLKRTTRSGSYYSYKSICWKAGRSLLVQTGDIWDRGDEGIEVQEYLLHLRSAARASGGDVLLLLGNHDVLNLFAQFWYAHPRETARLGGFEERRRIFGPTGHFGKKLRELPVAACVNDVVFVHAGLKESFAILGLAGLNRSAREEIANADELLRQHPLTPPSVLFAPRAVLGFEGPLWTRVYFQEDDYSKLTEPQQVLKLHSQENIHLESKSGTSLESKYLLNNSTKVGNPQLPQEMKKSDKNDKYEYPIAKISKGITVNNSHNENNSSRPFVSSGNNFHSQSEVDKPYNLSKLNVKSIITTDDAITKLTTDETILGNINCTVKQGSTINSKESFNSLVVPGKSFDDTGRIMSDGLVQQQLSYKGFSEVIDKTATAKLKQRSEAEEQLFRSLEILNAKFMVVGHTPQKNKKICSYFNNKLIAIDTGLSKYVFNSPHILLIEDNIFYDISIPHHSTDNVRRIF